MNEIVRADVLRGFPGLVAELGGDADALLHEAGIDPALLANGDAYISFRAVMVLQERAAAELRCTDFGMRLAARAEGSLGPLSIAIASAETARQAVLIAQRFMHFHNPSIVLSLSREDEANEFVGYELRLAPSPAAPQTIERGVAMIYSALKMLCGAAYRPKEVWFRHAPVSPLPLYREVFGDTPLFERDRNGLVVNRALLDSPQPAANAQVLRLAEHYLASVAPRLSDAEPIATRARRVIEQIMRSGPVTQADLAKALGLHERTLQRRLKAENVSFESLRDDVRRELAQTYLSQPDVPLSHVAEMLGYAEASAFTRAAHRWFGMSPRDMRKKLSG